MAYEPDDSFDEAEEPKKKGFFKQKKPEESSPVPEELEATVSRLRVLEERFTNLQSELRITEENMIGRNKKLTTEIKALTSDISELRKEAGEIKDKVLIIIKELQGFAKKADMNVLQRYIEMWEPMNFATHAEVREVIDEKIKN